MRTSRYHQILNHWVGGKGGASVSDENRNSGQVLSARESSVGRAKENETEWGRKWRMCGEGESSSGRSDRSSPAGVVSGVPSLVDIVRPLGGDLPNDVYLEIMSKYRCFLHELRIRLIEIFRKNSDQFKIQYKLDIVDERLALVEELGQEVYKLSAADLARIHTQKDKEECLMVDKIIPVADRARFLAVVEEEKFLLELNSKLRANLDRLGKEFSELEAQISQVDKQLREADQTSSDFVSEAIETFRKWSENAKEVIKAVERAN